MESRSVFAEMISEIFTNGTPFPLNDAKNCATDEFPFPRGSDVCMLQLVQDQHRKAICSFI